MKSILIGILFFITSVGFSQDLKGLIGKTYTDQSELVELKSFVKFSSKVDADRYIYRHYWNKITYENVFTIEKESEKITRIWTFSNSTASFLKLKGRKFYRVGQAYF